MKKIVLLAAAAASLISASAASAATLFDQSASNYDNRFVSQIFTDPSYQGAYDAYIVDDFTLSTTSHLDRILAPFVGFTSGFKSFDNVLQYTVSIYSSQERAAKLLQGDIYNFTFAANELKLDSGAFTVTGRTDQTATVFLPVNLDLAAGTYYLGVTALNDDGTNGQTAIATRGPGNAVITNPGGGYGQGNPIGLGQGAGYRIDGSEIAAVPEPATWAMMLLGFGMVGFGIRRRRTANTIALSYS